VFGDGFLFDFDLSKKKPWPIFSLSDQDIAELSAGAENGEKNGQKSSWDFVYGFGVTILNKPKKMILSQWR